MTGIRPRGIIMVAVKIIEMVGKSDKNWSDAAQDAVDEAYKTLKGIVGVDIIKMTGKVENGKIVEFKTNLKLAFKVRPEEM